MRKSFRSRFRTTHARFERSACQEKIGVPRRDRRPKRLGLRSTIAVPFEGAPLAHDVKPFNDLTGKKFGDLRVIAYAGTDRHRRRRWRVQCERCGSSHKVVLALNLRSGRSTTCGCIARFNAHQRMKRLMLVEKFAAMEAKGTTFEQAKADLGM